MYPGRGPPSLGRVISLSLVRLLFGHPPMTLATLGRIYANALRLKRKGAPFFSHPRPAGT